ncbi:MAG: hypothetical protein WBC44_09265 [Planctomycetaceae bacterium]
MRMPPGTLMEMRRLAEMLERSEELQAQAETHSAAFRAATDPTAAWVHDVRKDSCRIQAEHLRARFAAEAAELWPLLVNYAEVWSTGGRRAA